MDFAWVTRGSLSMSQNCAPHSARHYGLPQSCSALNTPWNFRGAAMAPLCSRTGLVGPEPKGRWRLSWTNRRCGRNLGSLIRTKLETPIKWMEGSTAILLVQRKCPYYNMVWRCCSLWHDIFGVILHHAVPPMQMVNAVYYFTFLQHHHLRPALRRKQRYLVVQNTIIFMTILLLSRTSWATDNGRFWNIHSIHPIWVHAITISSPRRANHCEGPGITQEMNLSVL